MNYYFDGFSTPEKSGYLVCNEDGKVLEYVEMPNKDAFNRVYTNNEAEYHGAIKALEIARAGDVVIGDSQLVIGQLFQNWKVKAVNLRPLYERGKKELRNSGVIMKWVKRDENKAGVILEDL